MKTRFPSFDFSNDVTDDDCIICNKLLVKHSEKEADQCYNVLMGNKFVKIRGVNQLW